MSETVFKEVRYDLGSLIKFVQLGEIALPEIQRPFVWNNSKVRDLFDSMYQGYPVGYLLFWQNGLGHRSRNVGIDPKQNPARLLIVDGQQRVTSLYAIVNDVQVIRDNYKSESIRIAFNPLSEKFEVTDSAIRRNKAYIPDISRLWSDETDLFEVVEEYLTSLESTRVVEDKDRKQIRKSISRLQGLLSYPFTALELSANISEEDVSEVFVRINSRGTPLNQADFILTLMSVFWDEGRAELESFCRAARTPSVGKPSPFNHFIQPDPAQLLRVSVGLGLKRARLKYVYSILRGKDLETEEFSDEHRVRQFKVLKDAQVRVLNLQHWHDFMNCVRQAGFRGEKMISSANSVLFSYVLYLMGRTEYRVPEFRLRGIIARWLFMSSLTGRFTGSPESAMEFDLARFRDVEDADGFVATLERACELALTDDFWDITLPNDLATSAARSPSLFAYQASLVLLEATALFSKLGVSELLDPALHGQRSAAERHHLFPRAYLNGIGIKELRDTNQIANIALVEWGDNAGISDLPPSEYLPAMNKRFDKATREKMYYWHALSDGWENLAYSEFLGQRRERMAQVIRDAYQLLVSGEKDSIVASSPSIDELIHNGESAEVEYKSTLRMNLHTGSKDPRMELAVLKTVAAFLNGGGGTLFVGIADDQSPLGLEADDFANEDKMGLHFVNLVKDRMGIQAMTSLHMHFEDYDGSRIMVVEADRAGKPVFVNDGNGARFFIRTGPSSFELVGGEMQDYIGQRFK